MGCVKVVVEEDEEKEEGVGEGEGEELGAVDEELAGPVVGETSRRRKGNKEGRKRGRTRKAGRFKEGAEV